MIGDLGNRFGELAEHLVAPNIAKKFKTPGFNFKRVVNGLKITKPGSSDTLADIDKHIKRMEVLRRPADQEPGV